MATTYGNAGGTRDATGTSSPTSGFAAFIAACAAGLAAFIALCVNAATQPIARPF